MNATTTLDSPILRKNSVLFWCTLVVPADIIALGINFILNPVGASTGYGIPIHDPAAFPFMWIKGIRDISLLGNKNPNYSHSVDGGGHHHGSLECHCYYRGGIDGGK